MHLKPCIPFDSLITLRDGSYKAVQELTIEDEVRTFNMNLESFDSANIYLNEPIYSKIGGISKIEIIESDLLKIQTNLKKIYVESTWGKVDEPTMLIHNQTAIMGGSSLGWLVGNLEKVTENRPRSDETLEQFLGRFSELKVEISIQTDAEVYKEQFKEKKKIKSIEKLTGNNKQILYCVESLEDGDSIYVNDVMFGVPRQGV
tara:strand:+ start:2304 stop:2912 length:609 start_codon:yes stop_codon:yes gene_type:complete